MSRSKKEIPHYYLKKRMSLDILMNWLDEKNIKLQTQDRLLLPSVLFKAIILSIKKFPELNGFYKNDNFKSIESINLGVAFSVEGGGVITPAILDAEKLNLMDLNLSLLNLSKRTKEGGLTNRELSEGTLTVTNLGGSGADEVFGIIFPPQVAIIGIGLIRKEPIVDEHDRLSVGFVTDISLSADHRVSDGLLGARFLNEMASVLKNPNLLSENKE
jgi:pyruvate dehydrogenase E2 component (dihydrolipoamide acetyltransferase)